MSETNSKTKGFEALIFGHFDHSLTEQQESELAQLLEVPETRANSARCVEGRLLSRP